MLTASDFATVQKRRAGAGIFLPPSRLGRKGSREYSAAALLDMSEYPAGYVLARLMMEKMALPTGIGVYRRLAQRYIALHKIKPGVYRRINVKDDLLITGTTDSVVAELFYHKMIERTERKKLVSLPDSFYAIQSEGSFNGFAIVFGGEMLVFALEQENEFIAAVGLCRTAQTEEQENHARHIGGTPIARHNV
jgi:hypothetical protein